MVNSKSEASLPQVGLKVHYISVRGVKNLLSNTLNNNEVEIAGVVVEGLKFSHSIYGEGFSNFTLKVARLSDSADLIVVTVSERLLKNINIECGNVVGLVGQFRSYNNPLNEGNRLILTVFARDIKLYDSIDEVKSPNQIYLNGFICKPPIYRTTPFGREIADILLAVNRAYGKSDYIPCIAWGRNARFAQNLEVGQNLKVWGRIQSREYQKKISDQEMVLKIAYEISVSKMEMSKESSFEMAEGDCETECSEQRA